MHSRRGLNAALRTLLVTLMIGVLLVVTPTERAQAVSGVVNTYSTATFAAGVPDSSGLDAGDCALVIQMTGTIATGLGTYEILDPANSPPTRSYNQSEAVQFVVLPGGCDTDVDIDPGGAQAQAWNGSTGGVIFLGGNTLTLNGDVSASSAGLAMTGPTTPHDGGDGLAAATSFGSNYIFSAPGGGGGVLGGGGGGASQNYPSFNSNNAQPGLGGLIGAGGAGGETAAQVAGGDGGPPGAPGNGGSSFFYDTGADVNRVGAGGAGGGSYGAGGGACGAHYGSSYSAGGGGGASWTGGGPGGRGGTSTGSLELAQGTAGADTTGVAIPLEGAVNGEHYLHADDPRLMMGGAGGNHRNGAGGANGGGIVVVDFNTIVGNNNRILADGGAGSPLNLPPASGAGGGGGGQMYIGATSLSNLDVSANGGKGGDNTVGSTHSANTGAGGGAGAIWFAGAGDDATNTGANAGATSAASAMSPSGFSNVTWQIAGGDIGIVNSTVVVGGVSFTALEWNAIYNTAGAASIANGTSHLVELSLATGQSTAAILEAFPALENPDNPKNAGVGCMPAGGGNGLLRVSALASPTLDIEKSTNGVDADVAPGETIAVGAPITWEYAVTVDGAGVLSNTTITDDQLDAAAIACDLDGDGTYESGNAVGDITAPASFLCRATGVATLGQYANVGTGSGSFEGSLIEDTDASHYIGAAPSITVEKQTNGVEADTDTLNDGSESPASSSDGASNAIPIGAPVTWSFLITNNGATPLTNVAISDATTLANDATHTISITCNWAASSDGATAAQNLSVGETVACSATDTSGSGVHENTATVSGDAAGAQALDGAGNPLYDGAGDPIFTPSGAGTFDAILDSGGAAIAVGDADASGYDGRPPSVSIAKTIVGTPDGDAAFVVEGQGVAWEFLVTNTGAGGLSNVSVSDPVLAAAGISIVCPQTTLAVGASMTCTASSVAGAVDLMNTADVSADPDGGGSPVSGSDEAEYRVGMPAIAVAKSTCTDPIAVPDTCSDAPLIPVGDAIAWYFVIENTGDVALVNVSLSDDVEPGIDATDCDWGSSTDAATPANVLSGGETVSCVQTGIAGIGDYANTATVTGIPGSPDGTPAVDGAGQPLPPIDGNDQSSYFGVPQPVIDVEKATNGVQADTGTGPLVMPGNPLVWTFVVTNGGNVDLADVAITDTVTETNGTAAAAITCDWAASSDIATPARNLSVGESVTCVASSTAAAGQYRNLADVSGTPVTDATTADPDNPVRLQDENGADVPDAAGTDPSAYFGPAASIDIEKYTNGNQADTIANQDSLAIGTPIVWTFDVTNDGNVDLSNVVLSDTVTIPNGTAAGVITCDWAASTDAATPARNLSAGETVTCTSSSAAEAGQYANLADVVATPVADAATADPDAPVRLADENGTDLGNVTDDDPSHYFGVAVPAIDVEKSTNGVAADTLAGQESIGIGADVDWTFVVTNSGDVDLADIVVTDVVTIDNGTAVGTIVCDWAASSDAATPDRNLSVGETVTCASSSTAAAGQYGNQATAVGTPVADATNANPNNPTPLVDIDGNDLVNVQGQDRSHYYGATLPAIDIEKDTNGVQADVGNGPLIAPGDPVVWTFVVTNVGNVGLGNVAVTDVVTVDNGTAVGAITCDWASSTDNTTGVGVLSAGEAVTCASSSTAAVGSYRNLADVVGSPLAADGSLLEDNLGNPLPVVTDNDPSAYFGPAPSIDLEKETNGNPADAMIDQGTYAVGDALTWTFEVTNNGNVDLSDVVVSDTVTTPNGTVAGAITCDWAASSDAATPARNLSVGETVTCSSSSTAEAGQYANLGDVVATPVADAATADPNAPVRLVDENGTGLGNVTDDDPSHYFGVAAPGVAIDKTTNGVGADSLAGQESIAVGADVVWTFVVTNTGDVDLAGIVVTDMATIDNGTAAGIITCDWAGSSNAATPDRNLSVGETVTCASSSTAAAGQYGNEATAVGTPVADATTADPDNPTPLADIDGNDLVNVQGQDRSHYYGATMPAIDVEKITNGVPVNEGYGPLIAPGDPVEWTFVVTNTGNVSLGNVAVTDVVTVDNGAAVGAISCDWAGSTDSTTGVGVLSPSEVVTCSAGSTAASGQHRNVADVVGSPLAADGSLLEDNLGNPLPVATGSDGSAYFGPEASINVEKETNGTQGDVIATQGSYAVGDALTWTFDITNDGNVDLSDVAVSDTVTIDNGTAAGTIFCDWAGSSDVTTPARNLSVGETVTCASASAAEAGQYGNLADVRGTPVADATTADPAAPARLIDIDGQELADVVDNDPSHYYGVATVSIDIEKDTNGNQADTFTHQHNLAEGDPVTWTFLVENNGDVDLAGVSVTDVVTIDNGTATGPVTCDWAASSDAATPARNLSVGETVTCASTSTVEIGQYGNEATATATPVADATVADPDAPTPLLDIDGNDLPVTDDLDRSHYYGAQSAIVVDKATNGNPAALATDQDDIVVGDPVVWTFVVTNTGNVDLADVQVTDTVTIDNGTAPDANGVVCDWANSSDPATPARNLAIDETVTCTSASTAAAGQYANNAAVTGTPVADATDADPDNPTTLLDPSGEPVPQPTDEDASHYFGVGAGVSVAKYTNGNQADVPADQEVVAIDAPIVWTFEIVNTGNVDLAEVSINDTVTIDNGTVHDPGGPVCDWAASSDPLTGQARLSVGEAVTCTSASTAVVGQYANLATATGVPVVDATDSDPTPRVGGDGVPFSPASGEDLSHYFGGAAPSISIDKNTNGAQADTPATQVLIPAGDDVVWTFVVMNDGDTDLADVDVTDTTTIDNGTTLGEVVCDWDASSDIDTAEGTLSVGESVTCLATSTAAPGPYGNLAEAVGSPVLDASAENPAPVVNGAGEPLDAVTGQDASHYFGAAPSVTVDKSTNGVDADTMATQPVIAAGDLVTWTFEVVNDGNTDIGNVTVNDAVVIDNGTAPPVISCDWDATSDADTPAGNLSVGESVVCEATAAAEIGQYGNLATITAVPVVDATDEEPEPLRHGDEPLPPIEGEDSSYYFGQASPSISVEKSTNGVPADSIAEQGGIEIGDDLLWTFVITNDGDVDLAEVVLEDEVQIDNRTFHARGGIVCDWAATADTATPAGALSTGETVECTLTGTANAGQYGNLATVEATPVSDASDPDPEVLLGSTGQPLPKPTDSDSSHYFGGFLPALEVQKTTNGVDADTMDDQPMVDPGSDVVWTFEVRNIGTVGLGDVTLVDTATIDNGTLLGSIVCDWAGSSDPATPEGNLSADESVVCTTTAVAQPGQYANLAEISAIPVLDATEVDPPALVDVDGQPFPRVSGEDSSHYFGAVLDLALRKHLADGSNDADTKAGDEVTFTITLFNQGNVPASNIEVVDYLPTGLELADSDWSETESGASITLGDLILAPGESTTVDITVRVADGVTGGDIEAEAEISDYDGVDDEGEVVRLIGSNGEPFELRDVDSVADNNNDETPVEDEIDNASGDEDDHDRVGLTIVNDPAPVVSTPQAPTRPAPPVVFSPSPLPAPRSDAPERPSGPLAFTGASTGHLAGVAGLLILSGSALVVLTRRREDSED